MMKRYWAAQLTVLSEIDDICMRHGLKWFADCGTLLGAVRNAGYIPWDDDMDIVMLRHDYESFVQLAKTELAPELIFISEVEDADFTAKVGRVVSQHAVISTEDYLKKYHGCPFTVGIDIFVLDGLSEDRAKEKERCVRAGKIERELETIPVDQKALRLDLRQQLEKEYSLYESKDARYLAEMIFWVSRRDHRYERKWFDHVVRLPYEFTSVCVPAAYEQVLKVEYGDFMAIHKGGGLHEYPLYRKQEIVLEKELGKNPLRYRISRDDMERADRLREKRRPALRAYCESALSMIEAAQKNIAAVCQQGAQFIPACQKLLEACQNTAISIGERVEEDLCRRDPKTDKAVNEQEIRDSVGCIEEYCETVFRAYAELAFEDLWPSFAAMKQAVSDYLQSRRMEILILPYRNTMQNTGMNHIVEGVKSFCQMADEGPFCDRKKAADIFIMPVAYYVKEIDGSRGGQFENEMSDQPEIWYNGEAKVVSGENYSIADRRPDMIVVQNPYDEWDLSSDTEEMYYARNLLRYTDRLIYVPPFAPDEPVGEEDKAIAAIQTLIEEPAVVYADRILLHSQKMKELYVTTLTDLCGEETKELWQRRVQVMKEAAL
ncbi:MAG: LicD family protein [Lachnospiraceae bacterium]|nr:LicD family protein [Lachnospiraceae bacterium]